MMRDEPRAAELGDQVSLQWKKETVSTSANGVESALVSRAAIRSLFESLERNGVRYCHWKSNARLKEMLGAAEDIDLLIDRRDARGFHAALLENGFKLAQSRSGIGHPGVFHALALDEVSADLVHVHAYFQIVSGDSLVKTYRLPVERSLLSETRYLYGVRVPTPEAELVLFVVRIALKHVNPIEILIATRDYARIEAELAWLRAAADLERAAALCTAWFPNIDPALLRQLLKAIEAKPAVVRRVVLGWRVARRLRGLRRLNPLRAAISRLWRVLSLLAKRFRSRRDLVLHTGGMIITLVGPKATGKSTLGHTLETRLGQHLDVLRIHAGKPPPTALTVLPRLFLPAARFFFSNERAGEYEKPERRREQRYSLLYILRMTLLAYDRRKLLIKALRAASAGAIIISDRYPSESAGSIDSCCFDEAAVAKCNSRLKRWLMNRERALYGDLPRAGLLLRLVAPIETTLERDAHRLKPGGPDAAAVRRRWELESRPEFSGTTAIQIDTNRPLDATVGAAMKVIWSNL